jgi:hypothetical protein
MVPENKPNPNPPAPSTGAGAKEGERQGANPLPPYVIPPQELQLLGWLKNAKTGDRLDLTSLLPPPPIEGAVRVDESTKFYNFRIRYIEKKKTLVILSRGYTFTVCPLQGARIYDNNKRMVRELSDCWAALLFSLADKLLAKYNYNIFSTKWFTASIPSSDALLRKFIALLASLINGKENELKDPFFRACLNPKTPS